MTVVEIIPIAISAISLVVSVITAYKTLFARFSGQVWLGNRIMLNRIDDVPSITLAFFFENSGAKLGILDDLRILVEHIDTDTTYKFFPLLVRDDYNIFSSYKREDWIAFGGIVLPPGSQTQKYVFFKPSNDQFQAQQGSFVISVQSRWYGKKKWNTLDASLRFELSEEDAKQWNDPKARALQVASDSLHGLR
jgi:hypothetical protein